MESILVLNSKSGSVADHISLARNGDSAATKVSWKALSGSVIPPALELEAICRAKHGLAGSAECGTATKLLGELKDGTSCYSLQRGGLGSYLWSALRGDCLDEIRKGKNRHGILKEKYPARREAGPSPDWYEGKLGLLREALLSLGGRTAKVAVLLHLDYWNMAAVFTGEELLRIDRIIAGSGGRMELSQTQIAHILGVANATVSREALRVAEVVRQFREDSGNDYTTAM
jgi:hypothetical protein